MQVIPLGSGSGGNCYFFESDGTRVLVDAGFGPRETAKRLAAAAGCSIGQIDAIVITHEHSDHVHGADRISRRFGIPLWLTRGTLEASRIDPTEARVCVFENNSEFRVGEISVRARRTIHDAADPACFVLEARDGTRVGIASDLGYVDPPVLAHLSNCDALLFEANHDLDMLRTGTYPWSLKRRILSNHGHLSNDDSLAAVRRMLGPDTRALCMIHLSEKNNHASIVAGMAEALLDSLGAAIQLRIAAQRRPGDPIEIARRPGRPARPAPPPNPAQMPLF
ncbi:MAG TPA: MBL fold metallo-hydrolase [Thermoanaerobaculia bacterium]|nr:MBL fold metallo-hydrolase [Thermoanaerobaculia bacterium]